jgi:hypothetical protein
VGRSPGYDGGESLKRHPVPLEESAIRAIANNSMTLDVYAWLQQPADVKEGKVVPGMANPDAIER